MHVDDLPTINKLVADRVKLNDDRTKLFEMITSPPPADDHGASCQFNGAWFHVSGKTAVDLMRTVLNNKQDQIEEIDNKLTQFGVSLR